MSTFPYLATAIKYGINYGAVIRYAEELHQYAEQNNNRLPFASYTSSIAWQRDVHIAYLAEAERRRRNVIEKVYQDNGSWKQCSGCDHPAICWTDQHCDRKFNGYR